MKTRARNEKQRKRDARRARVVRALRTSARPRLTVFRSARHIYAQLVDAETGRTLLTVSTLSAAAAEGEGGGDEGAGGKVEAARRVGKAVAEAARARQIDRVVFNRNGFLFHGRVKALADAARKAGLQF